MSNVKARPLKASLSHPDRRPTHYQIYWKNGDEYTAAPAATLPQKYGANEPQHRLENIKHITDDSKQDRSINGVGGNLTETG